MNNSNFLFKYLFITLSFSFISCDNDFATIGSEVIGDNHFDFVLNDESTVVAYTEKTNGVQSNGFPVNPLGIYNNPNFGVTKAHYVSQLFLSQVNPSLGNLQTNVIDSVKLYIPYFSKIVSLQADGSRTYELDSLYGGESKINLQVYENGFFLRNFDPNSENFSAQKYYTDDFTLIDNAKIGQPLNDDNDVSQNTQFFFNKREIIETKINESNEDEPIITRIAPGLSLKLKKELFINKIFNVNNTDQLLNNNNFVEHFRGLFFKVNGVAGEEGALNMLNFKNGKITIYYRVEELVNDDNDPSTPEIIQLVGKTLELSLSGNSASLIQQENSARYQQALENPNTTTGDASLWIKGNQGSLAVVKLFGRDDDDSNPGFTTELEDIRTNNWQINEASLSFVINKSELAGSIEPQRVFIYDIPNKRALVDFSFDQSVNPANPKLGKFIHGGIIEKEETENGRGIRYKVRITNHIRNVVRNDSTNVRLGLVVTEDIAAVNLLAASFRNPSPNNVSTIPAAAVMNPLGTIIYGTDANIPIENKLKLKIFYTKPN